MNDVRIDQSDNGNDLDQAGPTRPLEPRRRLVPRAFKLKVASAVTVASFLTVGGIAAMQSAGSGPALLILGAVHSAKSGASSSPTSELMRIYEQFNFTAGPRLSADSSSGLAYQLSSPVDSASEAARIATIFGVAGSPVSGDPSNQFWTVTDNAHGQVSYQTGYGVAQWSFNGGPPTVSSSTGSTSTSPGDLPSHAALEADARSFLERLGYGYTVSSPQFWSFATTKPDPSGVASSAPASQETVSYSVLVDGVLTDQSVQFSVDTNNNLTSASGPAFSVMSSTTYPWQSPVAGVAVLEAEQQSYFATPGGVPSDTSVGGGAVPPASSGSSSGSSSGGSATSPPSPGPIDTSPIPGPTDTTPTTVPTDTTPTTVASPPIIDVTLDSVSVSLQTYQLTDGSEWLLPVYTFSGSVTNSDGPFYTGSWSTIAIDSAYVHLSHRSSVRPLEYGVARTANDLLSRGGR